MKREVLLQATKHFQIQVLTYPEMTSLIQERANLIKPLLKHATLERLGGLPVFSNPSWHRYSLQECDQKKMFRMLNFHTEGIFGCYLPDDELTSLKEERLAVSKYWGLCRDSRWCFGKVEYVKSIADDDSYDFNITNIEFFHTDLETVRALYPISEEIWQRLGEFIFNDKERAEKRFQLVNEMASRVELENRLFDLSAQPE